ncbi:MAG TPA: hypothetical protein VJ836_02260 [Candidatus Saccharimonadales bacterium]|nr:hypothetical protein [Candidatus Saccharimonadales bacterium]
MTKDMDESAETVAADELSSKGIMSHDSTPALPKRLWRWVITHKKSTIPTAAIVVIALLAAIPSTRYALAGTVVKQQFDVAVVDSQTGKPVTSAEVMLKGKIVRTDNQGRALLRVPVGSGDLEIRKQHYKGATVKVLVPIAKPKTAQLVSLQATGRQVPIVVVNKISGEPVGDAVVRVADTQVKTDKKGEAVMVVPANKTELSGTVSAAGYNNSTITVKVAVQKDLSNTFALTPSGKVYFLSNQGGKIDVVKTDLDGSNRQVVLAGTGKEDRYGTVLLASRDWKYLALLSKRDGGERPKLFLIETATDKLTTMDEGEAEFTLYGWSGNRFVYGVHRSKVELWQPKRQALKSYDASAKKVVILDEVGGEGSSASYAYDYIGAQVYVFDKEIVYTKGFQNALYGITEKKATLNTAQADGSGKKVIKGYGPQGAVSGYNIDVRAYGFNELYIRYYLDSKSRYDEYEDGRIKAAEITDSEFYDDSYTTHLVSPSGEKTFWNDLRDGKTILFVGDKKAENEKRIVELDAEYAAYGWYTDNYILLSKKGSELLMLAATSPKNGLKPVKLSDYYKPSYSFRGYGYGYGGL